MVYFFVVKLSLWQLSFTAEQCYMHCCIHSLHPLCCCCTRLKLSLDSSPLRAIIKNLHPHVSNIFCFQRRGTSSVRFLKKKQWREGRRENGGTGGGVGPLGEGTGEGLCPLSRKFLIFFHFRIVHSGVFSYNNSKEVFAISCRERYIITLFFAIDGYTDMKTSSFY